MIRPEGIIILNDGETYTNLQGCMFVWWDSPEDPDNIDPKELYSNPLRYCHLDLNSVITYIENNPRKYLSFCHANNLNPGHL